MKKLARNGFLVWAVLAAGACASSPNSGPDRAQVALQSGEAHALRPGDVIRLSFSREPLLDGEYAIDEMGSTVLPLLGARTVTDRPAPEVKEALVKEYETRTRNQSVQVIYLRRVRVLGEVREPGLYHVDATMTFDDALALAGGASPNGNMRNVSLVRNGELVAEGLDASLAVLATVQSGDQIFVPKTSWLSRNTGVVIGASVGLLGAFLRWG